MSENIGVMRARVRLESSVRTPDNIGGASLAWSNQGDIWAEISAGGAGQSAAFDAAASVVSYSFSIHRRADVRAGWRIVWGTRVFAIRAVRDEGAPRLELIAEEERL
jgi:SPP1 family predicted phage head-tail adaptor